MIRSARQALDWLVPVVLLVCAFGAPPHLVVPAPAARPGARAPVVDPEDKPSEEPAGSLARDDPLALIARYAQEQGRGVSAYDIASHFSAPGGPSIIYGAEQVFNFDDTAFISVAALDATHFVVGYSDVSNFDFGKAVVGTVNGTSITYGDAYVFNAGDTDNISVAAFDATFFVVGYRDWSNSAHGTAILGAVSGTSITYSAEFVFNAASTDNISVAALDATHFVAGYVDGGNSDRGTIILGTVNGLGITYSFEQSISAADASEMSVSALDATHFVAGYADAVNANHGTAIVGVVTGIGIIYGAEQVFNAANTDNISVAALDATHFVVGYRDLGNSDHGTAVVGTVSGTSITAYSAEQVFNAASTRFISVSALDATHFVVGYRDEGNFSDGTAVVGAVTGTSITYGAEHVFSMFNSFSISVAALDATQFVVGFQGDSDWGTAIVGTVVVTRYVATTGSDAGNDCRDVLNPCLTLSHAVAQANGGDTLDVAAGTYVEPELVIDEALHVQGQGVVVQSQ